MEQRVGVLINISGILIPSLTHNGDGHVPGICEIFCYVTVLQILHVALTWTSSFRWSFMKFVVYM